jgi:formylglycine-generating enzyme required for sulfatase activity
MRLTSVLCLGILTVALTASADQRIAVFETAGPGRPSAELTGRIDAAVRRGLLLTLPPEGFSTLMAGRAAPGCTGRCAVDRAAEYGATMAVAARLDVEVEPATLRLTVYIAPDGAVLAVRRVQAGDPDVLVSLAGQVAGELARVITGESADVEAPTLVDVRADSLAAAALRARILASAGPNSLGMDMILVEPGRPFIDPPEDQHYIQARPLPAPREPYLLSATEVTQAQWEEVLGGCGSHFTGADLPVETVTWLDAVEFCNALSQREGYEPVYDIGEGSATWNREADGYRLPTDAEWEYACRAGSLTMFAAGGRWRDLERTAWFDRNAGKRTHEVATRQANAWGFHDMHGNVWEWIWDPYASLPDLSSDNVESPGIGPDLTIRGGSWYTDAKACRTTNFCRIDPGFVCNDLGFRVARTP